MNKIVERFAKVKRKIRDAIVSKGVDVPEDATLSEMAEKISEIKAGKINRKKEVQNV
ncbi:hypothetical protein FACS189449_09940 [Alphaproteobacteria bacterium]|nr:hypothetical protein FACS189449_09940 [Alphaproteobacteria bacterium]